MNKSPFYINCSRIYDYLYLQIVRTTQSRTWLNEKTKHTEFSKMSILRSEIRNNLYTSLCSRKTGNCLIFDILHSFSFKFFWNNFAQKLYFYESYIFFKFTFSSKKHVADQLKNIKN